MEQAARVIDLYVTSVRTKFMCFKQDGVISTLDNNPLKLFDLFTYFMLQYLIYWKFCKRMNK